MKRTSALALVVVLATASACSSTPTADVGLAMAHVPRASADPAAASSAADGVNAFGLDLYSRLTAQGGNLVLSPASIVLALAQARAGARGATADQMDAVLHGVASDANAAWLNALDVALDDRNGTFTDANGDKLQVALRIANAAFAQRDMTLKQAYLEALAERFGAGVRLVDYITATETARKAINAWVADQTEHRITDLLAPGTLTPDSRLTLVNAIYLKAPWQYPFEPTETAAGPFTRADGSTVSVPMMHEAVQLGYASGDGWQAVELPYVGGSLAMTIIVPDDLAAFEANLTTDRLDTVLSGLTAHEVQLTMPKFGIKTDVSLGDTLAAMGMPSAFDPARADFFGITDQEQLFISAVVHQANIDVDEKGTIASAATAVAMAASGLPSEPVTVRVDRPFLFLLRDLPTGTIIFMGRIADPSQTA
jgi:serine protease inhibitor